MFVRVVLPGTAVSVATHEGAAVYPKGHLSRAQRKIRRKRTGGRRDRSKREKMGERKRKRDGETTICHASAFLLREIVRDFSLLSFAPTLGLFVVQSRNSRDPWESTWESDSMGPIVFSTDISRRQRKV
ncbi:PREDICTED: uncharacterized protein LOC105452190 [Wasmannia auropunctata]|uniref:uncharacterized protein LOC105452190 n=1 Tax=Wasmannia auropunctata TaxID=64793 RepID=UPI0005F02FD7|nr:PREDICTED: uncharacterized protein LOC105452190 [Wasmannia auropunctata]